MAGWGIGLGGFTQGLDGGIRSGMSIANMFDERKDRLARQNIQQQEMDLRNKDEARKSTEFTEREADRQVALTKQKQDIDDQTKQRALFSQGNDAYNDAVKAGTAQPNDAYGWFAHTYAPHVEQFYLSKGDVQGAATFHKWSQDENTAQQIRDMGKLVGTYHDAVQSGDFDPLKAGMTKFYNDLPEDVTRGQKFTDLDVQRDASNNITAVNGTFKTPDGKSVTQNFGNLGQFQQYIQGVVNPASLYVHTMQSQEQADKFKGDINEYATKKGIDLKEDQTKRTLGLAGKTPQERYSEAQAALLKNSVSGQPPTDAQVRAYLAQQDAYARANAPGLGGAPAPSPQPAPVIVDTKTGKVVDPSGNPVNAGSQPAAPAQANPADITAPKPAAAPVPNTGPETDQATLAANGALPQDDSAPAPGLSGGQPQQDQRQPPPQPQAPIDQANLATINSQRKAKGLPPISPDQIAAMGGAQGGYGLPM